MFNRYGVPINSQRFMLEWLLACMAIWPTALMGSGMLLLTAAFILKLIEHLVPIFPLLISPNATPDAALVRIVVFSLVFGGYLGWMVAVIQLWIFQKHFGYGLRGFGLWSTAGGIAGVVAACLMEILRATNTDLWLAQPWWQRERWIFALIVVFVSILAAAQALALRRYLHGTWLWVLANLVGALALSGVVIGRIFDPQWLLTLLAGILLQGGITGAAALWLFGRMARSDAPDDEVGVGVETLAPKKSY